MAWTSYCEDNTGILKRQWSVDAPNPWINSTAIFFELLSVVAGFLLVVAIIGKIAAGWSFIIDKPTDRLVVGLGMMPRGEVGLIFLGLGTSAGLLTPSLEAAILLMVIGTTFLAPVLLRIVLKDKNPGDGNNADDNVAADQLGLR